MRLVDHHLCPKKKATVTAAEETAAVAAAATEAVVAGGTTKVTTKARRPTSGCFTTYIANMERSDSKEVRERRRLLSSDEGSSKLRR